MQLTASVKHYLYLMYNGCVSTMYSEDQVVPKYEAQFTWTVKIIDITTDSEEWKAVEEIFKKSLDATITGIARIENSWQWQNHKNRLSFKNSGTVNEKLLFRGTTQVDPKVIYMGEVGFDLRFSRKMGTSSLFCRRC